MTSGGKQGTSRGKRENPGNEVGSFYSVISPLKTSLACMFCSCVVFKRLVHLHYAVRM